MRLNHWGSSLFEVGEDETGEKKYGNQEIKNKKRDKTVVSNLNDNPREVLCILTSTGFLSEGVMQASLSLACILS